MDLIRRKLDVIGTFPSPEIPLTSCETEKIKTDIIDKNDNILHFFLQNMDVLKTKRYAKCLLVLEALFKSDDGSLLVSDFHNIVKLSSSNLGLTPGEEYDWLRKKENDIDEYKAYFIRVIFSFLHLLSNRDENIDSEATLDCLEIISLYSYENVPWTSYRLANLINGFLLNSPKVIELISKMSYEFIWFKIRPSVLVKSDESVTKSDLSLSNLKLGTSGYARFNYKNSRRNKSKLSSGGVGYTIAEESKTNEWKRSSNIKSIPMVHFIIIYLFDNPKSYQYWPLITSFILNLLEDYELAFKLQGVYLLSHFIDYSDANKTVNRSIISASGLAPLFIDNVKICLHYLPELTPLEDSLCLLSAAYPTLYKLLHLEGDDGFLSYLDVVNDNLLPSIKHINISGSRVDMLELLNFLLLQTSNLISGYLETDVIVGFSNLNKAISQIICNPFILEGGIQGSSCIQEALAVQSSVLESFVKEADAEGINLILHHTYDFLASWSLIFMRIASERYEVPHANKILEACIKNFKLLQQLTIFVSRDQPLCNETKKIQEKFPVLKELFI